MQRRHNIVILPSWSLATIVGLLTLAGVVLSARYLPIELAALASLLLTGFSIRSIALYALGKSAHAVSTLRLGTEGLEYLTQMGNWGRARLVRGSVVHPLLTIVTMRDESMSFAHRHVVLVPGRIDTDDFRWLRVWLKWNDFDVVGGASGSEHSNS